VARFDELHAPGLSLFQAESPAEASATADPTASGEND
jgi:phosphate transport system permease protein